MNFRGELAPDQPVGPSPDLLATGALASRPLDRLEDIAEHGGRIHAKVPLELVYSQDVPVMDEHVSYLLADMKKEAMEHGGTGQVVPVLLAEVPSFARFPIVDGFHRVAALQKLGERVIHAIIKPGYSWQDVYSDRVAEARKHAPIHFSRLIEWSAEAWNRTPWANRSKDPIRATQAFNLGFSERLTGINMGLTPEETAEIREWVHARCTEWHLKPGTIYDYLKTAEQVDPSLVKMARANKGSKDPNALTPQHVKAIGYGLPGPEHHELQRLVADVVVYNHLTTPQTRALVTVLHGQAPAQIAHILGPGLQAVIKNPIYTEGERRKQMRRTGNLADTIDVNTVEDGATNANQLLSAQLFDDELRIAALSIERTILLHRYDRSTSYELFKRATQLARPEALPYLLSGLRDHEAILKIPDDHRYTPRRSLPESSHTALSRDLRGMISSLHQKGSTERQAAVLHVFFGLSTLAMAAIMRLDEEAMHSILKSTNDILPEQFRVIEKERQR